MKTTKKPPTWMDAWAAFILLQSEDTERKEARNESNIYPHNLGDTAPTETMNRERVHKDGCQDFIQAYSLRRIWAVYPLILPTHNRIDPDPGVYIQQEMHMIWHHFHLNDGLAVFVLLFKK